MNVRFGQYEQQPELAFISSAAARAHAQKNCAAVILAIAQLAAPDLPPQARERLERMRFAAKRLVSLLNDEMREAASGRVEVAELFAAACDLVRDRAEARRVVLATRCAAGWLHGDAGGLTEVLVDLIGNAIDASPPAGQVQVDARVTADGGQRWVIEDAGEGMPADVVAAVGRVVRSSRPRGSGFGIALAARTIRAHGGTLRFEPRAGGTGGTRVVIELPASS
jgi:signal transduction histidine kinase